MITRITIVTALAVISAGCLGAIRAKQEQNRAISEYTAQAQANAEAAQHQARTEMYVVTAAAWFCPDAETARAGDECEGGTRFDRGAKLSVIGKAPTDGVWRAETFDADGQHLGFIAADGINELPDTSAIDDFAAEVDQAIPEKQRIPQQAISYLDFLEQPKAFRGRRLVTWMTLSDIDNLQVEGDTITFTRLVVVEPGSQQAAPVQFEMANPTFAREYQAGKRSYSCGGDYCDRFVIVAQLTDEQAKRVDEAGNLKILPVFRIDAMADRFGRYGQL